MLVLLAHQQQGSYCSFFQLLYGRKGAVTGQGWGHGIICTRERATQWERISTLSLCSTFSLLVSQLVSRFCAPVLVTPDLAEPSLAGVGKPFDWWGHSWF